MKWLYALFALDILNLAVFLPVFSAFVRSLGGTAFSLGVINSSSAFVSLLWNPIVGSLSDQVGRKGLLIKCLLASATGSVILALAPNLAVVFLGRVIGSMGSPVPILLRSIVADAYKTAEEKKTFFNRSAPFISVAFLVGSLSSGFLSEARNGYSKAFFLMAAITGTASLLAYNCLLSDAKSPKSQAPSSFAHQSWAELKKAALDIKGISWPRYKNTFLVKAGYEFGLAIIQINLGDIMLEEYQLTGRYMGYVFLLISVVSIVSGVLKLKLKAFFDRISNRDILVKGGLLIMVSFVGMSLPAPLTVFLLFMVLMCIGRSFLDTILVEIITSETTEQDRGKVIGAFENLVPLFAFLTPVLSGLIAEKYGERVITALATIPMGVAVLVAHRQGRKND